MAEKSVEELCEPVCRFLSPRPRAAHARPPRRYPLVLQLTVPDSPEHRESALLELSKKREAFADLAPILWWSFGTMGTLLQEIVSIGPLLCSRGSPHCAPVTSMHDPAPDDASPPHRG